MDEAQKHYAFFKPDIKEYILFDSIYMKFRQKLISSVKIEEIGCLWIVELIGNSPEGAFWGDENVLCTIWVVVT